MSYFWAQRTQSPLTKIGYANASIPSERKFCPIRHTVRVLYSQTCLRIAVFKVASRLLQVELKNKGFGKTNRILYCLGDRRNWQSQSPKGTTPLLFNTLPKLAYVSSERGLHCRPLWHFCKQKSPIPSQLPHAFGFWLRSDGGFGLETRWRVYGDWRKLTF